MKGQKKILSVCGTVLQLVVTIRLKETVYADSNFSVVLMDTIPECDIIAKRLEEARIFDEVSVFHIKSVRGITSRRLVLQSLPFHYDSWKGEGELKRYDFDILLGGNYDWVMPIYFNRIHRRTLEVYLIEDGTYNYLKSAINMLVYPSLKMKWKHNLLKQLKGQYVFAPELCKKNGISLPCFQVPCLEYENRECLNNIFQYQHTSLCPNVIYLDQCLDEHISEKIDQEFLEILKEKLGPDGFAVKLHPRSNPGKYSDLGIRVINAPVPFELFLLNNPNITTIISLCSTASVTPTTVFKREIASLLLYPLRREAISKLVDYDDQNKMFQLLAETNSKMCMINTVEEFMEKLGDQ